MELKTYEPHKSSIGGMDANVLALLVYVIAVIFNFIGGLHWFAWVVPLIFFYIEKDSQLVKFHAAQAFVLGVVSAIIYIILDIISTAVAWSYVGNLLSGNAIGFFGGFWVIAIISIIVAVVLAIFEIIAMSNAYKYKEYNIPLIGGLAEKFKAMAGKNKAA